MDIKAAVRRNLAFIPKEYFAMQPKVHPFTKASQLNKQKQEVTVKNTDSEQVRIDINIQPAPEGQDFLNVELKVEGQQVSGLPVELREFELASTFINTQYGKPRARLNLYESESARIVGICNALRELVKSKIPEAVLRDWVYNNMVDVGFPSKTNEHGARQPGSIKVRCGKLLHEMDLTQINERLSHLSPTEVDGRLNIWLSEKDGQLKGGFYFTVTRIVFDQ
jgi:hypothetical protein